MLNYFVFSCTKVADGIRQGSVAVLVRTTITVYNEFVIFVNVLFQEVYDTRREFICCQRSFSFVPNVTLYIFGDQIENCEVMDNLVL